MHDDCRQESRLAEMEEKLSHFEGWQEKQNGSLVRVEDKIDKLIFWLMCAAIGGIGTLLASILFFILGKLG